MGHRAIWPPADPQDDTTQAEYVYGPDYVDEFILQTRNTGGGSFQAMYMLQDANFNVVALTDGSGHVLEQYSWEPYGTQAAMDTMATPAPDNRVGHQGLFYYSFGNTGLYYNRNRWYSPTLGRFTTKDPNDTSHLIVTVLAMNGQALESLIGAFSASGHYGSGMNLYGYVGNNPLTGRDPLGLYDPFDEVDYFMADLQAQKAAGVERVERFAHMVAQMAQRMALEALVIAVGGPFGVAAVASWNAYESIDDILANGLNWSNGVTLGMSAIAIGSVVHQFPSARSATRRAYGVKIPNVGHHRVPREVLRKHLPRKVANDPRVRGKKGSPNVWQIPEDVHKQIHGRGKYNQRWKDELQKLRKPKKEITVDDVVTIRDNLVREFGLERYRP